MIKPLDIPILTNFFTELIKNKDFTGFIFNYDPVRKEYTLSVIKDTGITYSSTDSDIHIAIAKVKKLSNFIKV